MRKGVYGFYRRIELSENLIIIIANSDVLFCFKIFIHVQTMLCCGVKFAFVIIITSTVLFLILLLGCACVV